MEKTLSTRRRPARWAAGSLGLAVLVLVGCAGTIDGRASVGQDLLGSIGPTSSAGSSTSSGSSESSGSTESSEPAESAGSSGSSGSSETTADGSTSGQPSSDADTTTGSSSSSSSSTDNSTSTTGSSSSTGGTAGGSPGADGLTAPGTRLAYGAPAVLPFSYADAQGVFTLSGLAVTRGSEADWAALGVDTSDAQGEEPWYVRLTFTQNSGGDFSSLSLQDSLWAYTADDDGVDVVYPGDDANPLCPNTLAPDDFTAGQSYDTCVVLSVNLGESVDRVQYEGGYELDDPYYETPVIWKG